MRSTYSRGNLYSGRQMYWVFCPESGLETFPSGKGQIIFMKRGSIRTLFIGINVLPGMIWACGKPEFSLCMLQNHFLIPKLFLFY